MTSTKAHDRRPLVVVVGCDDVGSAIACTLHRAGFGAVVVDGADPPWARRGMSYTDAWYVGGATLDGVDACFCASVKSLPAILARGDMVAATTWSWGGVAAALRPVAVVEVRAGRVDADVMSRPAPLAGALSISVLGARVGGWPADIVLADNTSSGAQRDAWRPGAEIAAVVAPHGGRFRTRHEIAERVEAGDIVGELGSFAVVAPIAGIVLALCARGARVAAGQTLAEIHSQSDAAGCFGTTDAARAIAHRVHAVLRRPPAPAIAPRPNVAEAQVSGFCLQPDRMAAG